LDISNKYYVEITGECKKEIKKVYNYIKEDLGAEKAAQNLMKKIEETIKDLIYTPKMYVKIDKYKGIRRNYHKIVINNYILLYTIEEETKKVYISHIYYGGSNYLNKLLNQDCK
jgi:addiction module RelE/StbE family toxin